MCSEISSLQSVKVIENYRELISTHSTGKGLSTHGVSAPGTQRLKRTEKAPPAFDSVERFNNMNIKNLNT